MIDTKILLEDGVWMRCVSRDDQVMDFTSCQVTISDEGLKALDLSGEEQYAGPTPRSWWAFERSGTLIRGDAEPRDFPKLFVALRPPENR